jgi:hypothetical protein
MRLTAISIAVVLVVIAAGCGGKKTASSESAQSSTTTSDVATTESMTTETMTTDRMMTTESVTTDGSETFASLKNCAELENVGRKFAQAMAAANGTAKTNLTALANAYTSLASAAPAAIRSDFETIAAAFQTFVAAVQKTGFAPGKVPTPSQLAALAAASKSLSTPKLQAAAQHLTAWGTENCHG